MAGPGLVCPNEVGEPGRPDLAVGFDAYRSNAPRSLGPSTVGLLQGILYDMLFYCDLLTIGALPVCQWLDPESHFTLNPNVSDKHVTHNIYRPRLSKRRQVIMSCGILCEFRGKLSLELCGSTARSRGRRGIRGCALIIAPKSISVSLHMPHSQQRYVWWNRRSFHLGAPGGMPDGASSSLPADLCGFCERRIYMMGECRHLADRGQTPQVITHM